MSPKDEILYENAVRCVVLGVHFGVHTPKDWKLDIRGCDGLVVASADYILTHPESFLEEVKRSQELGA